MTCPFDQAQDEQARQTKYALERQAAVAASTPKLVAIGECWNELCNEPLEKPRLFCGPKCAVQHSKNSK